MNHKENQLIFERYANVNKPAAVGKTEEALNEGLIDRVKSKAAGAVGAVKGAVQQVKGTVQGAVAGAKGDQTGVQKGIDTKKAGKTAGPVAKVESYRKTAIKKFDGVATEVFDDLKKLGIDVQKVSPQSLNNFKKNLNKAFDDVVANIKK